MPEKFENCVLILKMLQMFSFRTTPEESENSTITDHFESVFEERSITGLSPSVSKTLYFPKNFSFTLKRKAVSISSGLKNHSFRKALFS